MREKNIFVYKLLMLLNISDFSLLFMKRLNLKRKTLWSLFMDGVELSQG